MASSSLKSKTHLIEDYSPPLWYTPKASIRFELDLNTTIVRTEYLVVAHESVKNYDIPSLFLNGIGLQFLSVRIDGVICEANQFELSAEGILIKNPPATNFRLQIENSISPKSNTALEGLYHSGTMLCTQNEPEGFRKIAYSIDRPDNLIQFQVTLIGDRQLYPVLLSNGNEMAKRELDDGKHEAIWVDPFPKPSYLFAIVAGNLAEVKDTYRTSSGREVILKIFVNHNNLQKTDFAMMALKEAMRWDEETFDLEYDLDLYMIVAVDDFNMGAMENKGLNLFNSKLVLADKKSATDETFESILAVVAHEYFHNWTGNRVTLRNWFNLTLKEGLTVFRDQWFTEDKTDVSVKRIKDVLFLQEHQFAEDAGPMSHPILPKSYVEMNNFYTVTVYEKGAEVIRMLSVIIGRERFKLGLKHYLSKYDGMGVTYEEFILAMEEVSEESLGYFKNWYHRKGTPTIRVEENWDPATGTYQLSFIDTEKGLEPLCFPISMALFDTSGRIIKDEIAIQNGKLLKREWKELKSKPIVSLFRSFSAPVKVVFNRPVEDLIFLAKWETDGFSRFFSLQEVIKEVFASSFLNEEKIQIESICSIFREYFVSKNKFPTDYFSYLLRSPSLTQLSDFLNHHDYERLNQMRQSFVRSIANEFANEFKELYLENKVTTSVQTREQIGKRRLKALALSYLVYVESWEEEVTSFALQEQESAEHMSEELFILRMLCEVDHKEKYKSVQLFYEKWKHDPLVLDYWFSAQVSFGKDALPIVTQLQSLPEFHWENPNRVRSLFASFGRNPRSFHREDGSGYRFMISVIERLNGINPQIASSLAKLFQSVNLQAEALKQIAKAGLEGLSKTKGLSNDLEEIILKIMKGL